MTENKRYFERKWEGEFYIFDSNTISEDDFEEKLEYESYAAYGDSMMGKEVVNRLNELNDENKELKETLAFRSNQLALMEQLVDDLGSEEMTRQMEEILNG